MMGRHKRDQEQLFYSFCLEEAVPDYACAWDRRRARRPAQLRDRTGQIDSPRGHSLDAVDPPTGFGCIQGS
jgi:hypothetical protein